MIAFADTPDDLRQELFKLLDWQIKTAATRADYSKLRRDALAANAVKRALESFRRDLERLTILPKSEHPAARKLTRQGTPQPA